LRNSRNLEFDASRTKHKMSRPVEEWLETFQCEEYAESFDSHGYSTLESASCASESSRLGHVVNINDVMSFGGDVVCLRHSIVIFIILLSLVCSAELTKLVILASRRPRRFG
jgi:hypothetical protein